MIKCIFLSIYKFCDIYALLIKWGEKSFFKILADSIQRSGVQKDCCYALTGTLECYPSLADVDGFQELIEKITPKDTSFMKEVAHPQTGDIYVYEESMLDWLFTADRFSQLHLKTKGVSL